MRPLHHYLSAREVGERIRALRKMYCLTQSELASKVGVSKNAVSSWENGEYAPCVPNICVLSDIFEVHPLYFVVHDSVREEENKE